MPISFSLRSVAWLGVPRSQNTLPSGAALPQMSADLVYADAKTGADEIQYLVHGCPQVAMVSAVKGDSTECTLHGLFGELLYRAYSDSEDEFPIVLSEDHYAAIHAVYAAFTTERAAGRLR